ncbi:MAG: hypothetical protein ACHRHE_00975 [Tepidisphaerales bacterium]
MLGLGAFAAMGQAVDGPKPAPVKPDAPVILTLSPRASERPALRYRLTPFVGDQIPGNAAPIYLIAIVQLSKVPDNRTDADQVAAMLETPIEKFDREAAAKLLGKYQGCLHSLEQASLRESCEWGLPIREDGIRALLPHLADMRQLSSILCLRVRLDVVDRNYDQAVRWLRVGFALSRHLNCQAVLIQGLVSAAVAGRLNNVLRDFVQAPDAPNLAWPLANLPRPFLDVGKMLEWERAWLYFTFPTLKEIRGNPMTPEQWQSLVGELAGMMDGSAPKDPLLRGLGATALGMWSHAAAKDYLLRHGYTQKQLDVMPPTHAIGIFYVDSYEGWCDELFKWAAVPYWQARLEIPRVQAAIDKEGSHGNIFMQTLPAVSRAVGRIASLDRDLAAMYTIECIRGYAGQHGGKLPATLAELKDPPPPVDPFTGKLLDWEVDDVVGVLSAPVMPDDTKRVLRFEIHMRPAAK